MSEANTRNVYIAGVGQTPVGEHWGRSLRDLAGEAAQKAVADAEIDSVDQVLVANMLAGPIGQQEHLGALIAEHIGLRGAEGARIDAADASGGAALRQGFAAVASGLVDSVMVVGVEKFTDAGMAEREAAAALTLDRWYEADHGATPTAMAAILMRRYMMEYGGDSESFFKFSAVAHANGAKNPQAMYRRALRPDAYQSAVEIAPPITMFDAAPLADGAAAVILTSEPVDARAVVIASSASATDTLAVQNRRDPLWLDAAATSAKNALTAAGVTVDEVDIFELHDSFTILTVLALEAIGLAEQGQGHLLGDQVGPDGPHPIATFGGLKARGHAGGATGVYQAVEIIEQLRGTAGDNQIEKAVVGLTQNLGGIGSTAITHIFKRY